MGIKVERRTDVVYLYTNEDQQKISDLTVVVERAVAAEGQPRRITDGEGAAHQAAKAYDAFVAKAAKRATQVRITALPGRLWRQLLADHPPREDVTDADGRVIESFMADRGAGFNVDAIAEPLVLASLDLDQFDGSDADREAFTDDLSDPDFSRVFSAAVRLNTEAGPDPKFRASSWLDQRYAGTSKSAPTSDSSPARSTD